MAYLSSLRYIKFILSIIFLISLSSCTNMFFQPLRQHLASPEQYGIEYEDVTFKGSNGLNLHGWWFPADLQENETAMANVLFVHGNAENISTHSGLAYWLIQHKYNVFIFDYRGYGKSEGEVNLPGALDDISRARNYLVQRGSVVKKSSEKKKLFIVAHSLGASMSIYSLAKHPDNVDGAIMVSPFSSYPDVAQQMLAKRWFTWPFQWLAFLTVNGEYDPIDYVSALPLIPKLYVYSEEDKVIHPDHIKKLYKHSSGNKFIERLKGKHNSIFAYEENQKKIISYLNSWTNMEK